MHQSIRTDLRNTIFRFWSQWLLVSLITIIWVLITFFLKVPNCPTGYLGPGGKHDGGKYLNCTGGNNRHFLVYHDLQNSVSGAAGYIDRIVVKPAHMYNKATCKKVYQTVVPFDPSGNLI
jgi:heparan-alpha-glucosaminide N-acetyltransferase